MARTVLGMFWDNHFRICFYSKALSLISFAGTNYQISILHVHMFQAAQAFEVYNSFHQQKGSLFFPMLHVAAGSFPLL